MVAIDIRLSVYGEYICPECYCGEFGYHSGNVFCRDCGLVVYNEEQTNQMYYENYMKDIENLKNHLEERRVKEMQYAHNNGIKLKVDKMLRGMNVGDREYYMSIKELSKELRSNGYCLNRDKDIYQVKNGRASPVADEFIIGLLNDVDKFHNRQITSFTIDMLKSELFLFNNITLLNKEISTDPLINIPKLKLRIIEHNKNKVEKIPVNDMRDAGYNNLIDYNFFISGDNLYRFELSTLWCFGELDKKSRIDFTIDGSKKVILLSSAHKKLIKENLLNIPASKLNLVFEELQRVSELEQQKELLRIFHQN